MKYFSHKLHKYTDNRIGLYGLLPLILLAGFFLPMLPSTAQKVFAAPPGCYIRQTDAAVISVPCPNEALQRRVAQGICFISTQSSQGGSSFREAICDDITVQSAPQPSQGGGTGARNPQPDPLNDPLNAGDEAFGNQEGGSICGKGDGNEVRVSLDFGCRGADYNGETLNPIVDMAFALFRFLSFGVGIVVIGSIAYAGIQYSASRGNPQATQAALKRIASSVTGLLIYIFMFAIANFVVPGGLFR